MKQFQLLSAITAFAVIAMVCLPARRAQAQMPGFRPPAVPLVTSDPYLSIWSEADRLTDDVTRHWTHHPQALDSLIRIDGKAYRLMGVDPAGAPPLPQTNLQVLPTRSIYDFQNAQVHVTMTFMTAALPHDLNALTQPLSYITWDVRSVDGANHAVSIYDSASSQLAVNTPDEPVTWAREPAGEITAMRVGTASQPILGSSGDDHRIDWGYAYLAAPAAQVTSAMGGSDELLNSFVADGKLPAQDDARMPRPTTDDQPVLALEFDLGNVGATPISRHAMVAYDEIDSILYYRRRLQPFWRRNGATPEVMLNAAEANYARYVQECERFDQQMMADLNTVGGPRYAQVAALAYRQCLAANGYAADANKQLLMFTKENTSNGDIATVDVIFPQCPLPLLVSPTLAKAGIVPVLMYAASSHWKFPNAPHDLGTYPIVSGRDDGGEGMPVEESGNLLIICDAISQEEGNANFVTPWWGKITQWAQYLQQYGLDPENQLCTDDFMGHLAHNANLSVKAILGLAAYGDMCKMRGDIADAQKYTDLAKADAQHWVKVAADDDHYRLAFDKPNTWSQKYNLVWDKILGLNIFPPEVAQKEVTYYKKMEQRYGAPLDSRTHLTKTDWSFWSATLADNRADFESIISPIYDYLNTTTSRVPLVDSYVTDNIDSSGMHARPVVGGLFIKMLTDRAIWHKWSSGDKVKAGPWAPLPTPPQITEVVPTAQKQPVDWRYTTAKPAADWMQPNFDDTVWKQGPAGFGTSDPGVTPRTPWTSDDIWIRREITIPEGPHPGLQWFVYHDEDVDIYVNGIPAGSENGFTTDYEPIEIPAPALALLKPGAKVLVAAHCHQTAGGQFIDIGLASVVFK